MNRLSKFFRVCNKGILPDLMEELCPTLDKDTTKTILKPMRSCKVYTKDSEIMEKFAVLCGTTKIQDVGIQIRPIGITYQKSRKKCVVFNHRYNEAYLADKIVVTPKLVTELYDAIHQQEESSKSQTTQEWGGTGAPPVGSLIVCKDNMDKGKVLTTYIDPRTKSLEVVWFNYRTQGVSISSVGQLAPYISMIHEKVKAAKALHEKFYHVKGWHGGEIRDHWDKLIKLKSDELDAWIQVADLSGYEVDDEE